MGDLFGLFTNNLLPVFLAAGAGFVLGKVMKLEPQALARVAFYIFSPCLVFDLLTSNALDNGEILRMAGYAFVQMTLVTLLAGAVGWLLRFERRLLVAVMLAAMMPNAGNYGLSVNLFAFGEAGLAYASLYFITSAIMANTVGVYLASLGRSGYREALLGLFKIPTIYAVILALVFIWLGWSLPTPLARPVEIFSNAAIPTMLILLGLQLGHAEWNGKIMGLVTAGGLKLIISPLIGLGLSAWFGMTGPMRQAGVLEAAMPTAVMATVLATEFEIEPAFITATVFLSTLLSPLTLTPLLAFLGS
ncbi:MAG: AEC family transporter [Anaerolineales bacterium]|nr:AEC family transporter [Anaerolineales bacterium]